MLVDLKMKVLRTWDVICLLIFVAPLPWKQTFLFNLPLPVLCLAFFLLILKPFFMPTSIFQLILNLFVTTLKLWGSGSLGWVKINRNCYLMYITSKNFISSFDMNWNRISEPIDSIFLRAFNLACMSSFCLFLKCCT